jgi:hypothetical protein
MGVLTFPLWTIALGSKWLRLNRTAGVLQQSVT